MCLFEPVGSIFVWTGFWQYLCKLIVLAACCLLCGQSWLGLSKFFREYNLQLVLFGKLCEINCQGLPRDWKLDLIVFVFVIDIANPKCINDQLSSRPDWGDPDASRPRTGCHGPCHPPGCACHQVTTRHRPYSEGLEILPRSREQPCWEKGFLASGRCSSFDGRVNRIKSCSGQWTDKPGGDTWPTKVTTEQHLFWILYRSTSVSWGAKTSTNMIDLSKIQNFTSIDVYHRQCNWTLNIYVSLYITHLMVMTMLVKMAMKMVTWQKQTWRQDPDQGPGFWPEISWINWKGQFWPKPALKPFLSLVYL